jgi:hypothetical protein
VEGAAPVRELPAGEPATLERRPARLGCLGGRLRDPLVAFLVAGAALFLVYRLLHPVTGEAHAVKRIVVTQEDLHQMSVAWLAQGRQPPTEEEMRHLVERWVRDEILFREALELGLDQSDTIVKRRMVQKMEFLAEDLSDLREPTREDLEAFLRQNASRFVDPPRATFRHLYFSPDRRGAGAREAAEQARVELTARPAEAPDPATLADRFMLQDYYPQRTPEQVAKDFGPGFAREVFSRATGGWQGPIESGLGWHLVWIEVLTPGRLPELDEIEGAVRNAWIDERRDEFKRRSYARMRARYEVVLPDTAVAPSSAVPGEANK